LNTLLDTVRSNWGHEGEEYYDEPSIGIATASTGIAATVLKLGQKFNSKVKAPCTNLIAEIFFPISYGSELAWVISMAHKHLMTGIDRLFQDLMQDDRLFGGKLVVMSGDFRQKLTIVSGGSDAQITNACLKRSPLWNTVTKL
jgi:hypothetical protein